MKNKMNQLMIAAGLLAVAHAAPADGWKPVEGTMLTQWGGQVTPENAWMEYPRPQMVRKNWTNLNGLWDYGVTLDSGEKAAAWEGEILVPYALESPLSGVGRRLEPTEALWYRRTFDLKEKPDGRLLIHFEAVDYESTVWVNGKKAGSNVGGNLPFSFDITGLARQGENEIIVKVIDRTDADGSFQLRGKQRIKPGNIFYTPVSGIWQTVWLEEVPQNHIQSLKISAGMNGEIRIEPTLSGKGTIKAEAWLDGKKVAEGGTELKVGNPKLWSPGSPTLYDLKIALVDKAGKQLDQVESYTGIREVGKEKGEDGKWRFTLNGKPVFHLGPLDQGWWPDGLLTPPSEEAMLFELGFLKKAGFNMLRKHIKVEPRRYYYHCDRMGLLVWQDQVSGGSDPKWQRTGCPIDPKTGKLKVFPNEPGPGESLDAEWPDTAHEQWMAELKGMIDHLYSHPSIVVWIPFNERWGQHRTMNVGEWIVKYDPTRLINIASGGNFFPVGDVADAHSYPHPSFRCDDPRFIDFIRVVGEFGGHGWKVNGHVWKETERYFVYGDMPQSMSEFKERYAESIRMLNELREKGISGGVYTQTTDVEGEINGLMTYDRAVIKIPSEELHQIHKDNGLIPE